MRFRFKLRLDFAVLRTGSVLHRVRISKLLCKENVFSYFFLMEMPGSRAYGRREAA